MAKYFSKITAIATVVAIALIAGFLMIRSNLADTQPENTSATAAVQSLDSRQLAEMLKNKDFTLVNVHVPYDGEIEKTDAFIAYNTISVDSPGLPTDKNAKIVVYCKTGRMSRIAADTLTSLGYTSVYDLSSGMDGWQASGYQLIRSQ